MLLYLFWTEPNPALDNAEHGATLCESAHEASTEESEMKRAEIKNRHADGATFDTQIVPNPTNTKEWIVLFKKDEGLSFFLVDEHEQVESFSCLDELVQVLRELGIKNAEVHF